MGFGSVLSKIFGGDTVSGLVLGVMDRIKLAPEKKAEISLALEQNKHELAKMELELRAKEQDAITKEVEAASANIRAEAMSGDRYTSRARPSFIYMMLIIMICNYIIFPIIGRDVLSFPEALFWLFGSVMLGYTGARSWEKFGLNKKFFNGNGGK